MKQLTTLCLALFVASFCNAQSLEHLPRIVYTGHTLADNELKGNVKTLTILSPNDNETIADLVLGIDTIKKPTDKDFKPLYIIDFDEQGRISTYLSHRDNTAPPTETTYSYNTQGKLVLVKETNGTGKISYKYDAQGRILEMRHNVGRADGSVSITKYVYDKQSIEYTTKLDKKTTNKVKTLLDEQGRIIQMTHYNCVEQDCKYTFDFTYQYTTQGKLAIENTKSEKLSYSTTYEYNDKGQHTKTILKYEALQSTTVYTIDYDANGNLFQYTSSTDAGFVQPSAVRYEHDAQGNWIKKFFNDICTEQRQIIYR